jgi:hypothetical protein
MFSGLHDRQTRALVITSYGDISSRKFLRFAQQQYRTGIQEVRAMTAAALRRVSANFRKRLRQCIRNGGRHLPAVMFKKRNFFLLVHKCPFALLTFAAINEKKNVAISSF